MNDQEVQELANIINWCDDMDRKNNSEHKTCGNCKHIVGKVMCYHYDDDGQSVIVSTQSSCNKFTPCSA